MAAASIDEYLAKVPDDQRAALERVRREVQRLVPDAEEMISYGMPGFSLHGRSLLWFAGWKKHCSLYPLTDAFLGEHADELAGFEQTRGSVHFTPQQADSRRPAPGPDPGPRGRHPRRGVMLAQRQTATMAATMITPIRW
jgi:uncharacterized protein YdhG (YjbR/CyaY superfamily)